MLESARERHLPHLHLRPENSHLFLNGKVNTFIVEERVYFEYILRVIKVMAKFWLFC